MILKKVPERKQMIKYFTVEMETGEEYRFDDEIKVWSFANEAKKAYRVTCHLDENYNTVDTQWVKRWKRGFADFYWELQGANILDPKDYE